VPTSACCGVALQATEVEKHAFLVADDPSIVPRRHVESIAGTKLALGSIIHSQRHAAFQNDRAGEMFVSFIPAVSDDAAKEIR